MNSIISHTSQTKSYLLLSSTREPKKGFTLVELLVVISIIAVLAAILLTVTQRSRESANAAKCVAKIRAIGTALNVYRTDKVASPKAAEFRGGFTGKFWFVDILPYLDNATFDGMDDRKETALRCPSAKVRSWPFIDYAINGYALPPGPEDHPFMKVENPSTTFLVAEADGWIVIGWTGERLDQEFRFRHGNAANVVMFDGHVEKVTKAQLADPKVDKKMKGLPET